MIDYLYGFLIGFALAMPTGPVGLLIFRNTLIYGPVTGFVTLSGQVFSKAVYLIALLCGFSGFITGNKTLFSALSYTGALAIAMLAVKFIRDNRLNIEKEVKPKGSQWARFANSAVITIFNPSILFIFVGAVAMVLGDEPKQDIMLKFLIFNMLGSITWFTTMILCTAFLKKRMLNVFLWINRICPYILLVFSGLIVFKTLTRG